MDSLVFDTSALLNFGHRGELAAVLKKLSGEYKILTTPGARSELTDPKRKDYYAEFLRQNFTVQSAATSPFNVATLARLTRTIDPGEITVMALAREIKGIAVPDDKAARREAKWLDLRITGTLGLLHQGLQRKWLIESECLARVAQLCGAGFSIPRPAPSQSFADYFAALDKPWRRCSIS
jgi:predicted nucleic acid-binding protein